MPQNTEAANVQRLEDFIALAQQGKKVTAEISLRRQLVEQKVHPDETSEVKEAISMYLLLADFTLTAEGKTGKVSKVYTFGSGEESLDGARVNKGIANARLKMDYRRLKDAGIICEEKLF